MELIRFIFSSFWIFCGMIILISVAGAFIVGAIGVIRGSNVKISVFGNVGDDDESDEDEEGAVKDE
jgi:hypothetical protein